MRETPGSEAERQLPIGDEIFLDHVAHFVRDADAATRALIRAGFEPTPVSIQVNPEGDRGGPRPTGTANVTAMLSRGYIEILFKTGYTPLAGELDAGINWYEGVHLVALAVADAARWHQGLAEQGFRVRQLSKMERQVDSGGAPAKAAFTVARVESGEMPEGRIQMLTHRTEEIVWQPRWLSHPNGASVLLRVIIAVADPEGAAQRYARFTRRPASRSTLGCTIGLDRGCIELMTIESFKQMLPEIPVPCLPFIGAYAIRTTSLASVEEMLTRVGLKTLRRPQSLIASFPEGLGQGAWVFEE
jgi:Glyoxalase-like domain